MTKVKKSCFITAGIVFAILAVIFFFYDLDISKFMVQKEPWFIFKLLAAVGEFPIYVGPILFGVIYGFTSDSKKEKLLFHMIGLIMTYVGLTRITKGVFSEIYGSELGTLQYVLLPIVSLLIYVLIYITIEKVDEDKLIKLRDLALLSILVSALSFIIVSGVKFVWGRPRYWSLSEDFSEYKNCLSISGLNNGLEGNQNRSFPSGHTNSASCIMIVPFFINRLTNKKWIRISSLILCYGYILLVAISRICVGAHYASDVLFGFAINCMCFTFVYIFLKKKGWLHVRNDKC
jgi:membrane-associated phospholipid phosphatase